MLVGHLLCGMLFAALLCAGCLVLGLSLWGISASLFVGANIGLGASALTTLVPWRERAARANRGAQQASRAATSFPPAE